ncbi:MAG: hypothetical protein GF308_10275 [Candidatus Heimdallarchaeota archaeon]|nr:hypothetical protein [Candidatus Heimdallarchaeota archaeon]
MKDLTRISQKIKPISIQILILLSLVYFTCLPGNTNISDDSSHTKNDDFQYREIIHIINGTKDSDNDGLTDEEEEYFGTDPNLWDTDGDGLSDWYEVYALHTDPINSDSDQDGLTDGDEIYDIGSNPMKNDSDDDGLLDGKEFEIGTNPCKQDTDGDGLDDLWEVTNDFNPLKRDKWILDIQVFVLPPILGILTIVMAVVGLIQMKNKYWTHNTQHNQANKMSNEEILYDFLCNLPENQELSLQECSELLCCSDNELLTIILTLFQPAEFPMIDKGTLKEIVTIRCFSDDHYSKSDREFACWDHHDLDYLFVQQRELIDSGCLTSANYLNILMI